MSDRTFKAVLYIVSFCALSLAILSSCQSYSLERIELAYDYFDAAQQWDALGQQEKAEAAALRSVELYPQLLSARLMLAEMYAGSGRFESALEQLPFIERSIIEDRDVLELVAYIHASTGNYNTALELYAELISDRETAAVLYNLGQLYNRLDNEESALSAFERAIAVDEGFVEAVEPLVGLWYEDERYQEMVLLLESFGENLEDYPVARLYQAAALHKTGLSSEFFAVMEGLSSNQDRDFESLRAPDLREELLKLYAYELAVTAMDDERALSAYQNVERYGFADADWVDEQLQYVTENEELPLTREYLAALLDEYASDEAVEDLPDADE